MRHIVFPLILLTVSTAANAVDTSKAIELAIEAMNSSARGYAGAMLVHGKTLAGYLMGIAFSFYAIKTMLEDSNFMESLSSLVRLCFLFGAVNLLITRYGDGGAFSVPDLVTGTAAAIRNSFGLDSGIYDGLANLFAVASAIYEKMVKVGGWTPDAIIQSLGSILFGLATVFVLLIAALLYAASYFCAQFMMAIAIALGPIFLPWVLLPISSWVASSWFKFFLTAMAQSVVGGIMLALTQPVLTKLVELSGATFETGNAIDLIGTAGALLVMAALVAYMMTQIDNVAQGLFSGGGTMNFSGSRAISGLAAANRALGGAGRAASSTGRAAASASNRAAAGAITGASKSMGSMAGAAMNRSGSARSLGASAKSAASGAISSAKNSMKSTAVGSAIAQAKSNYSAAKYNSSGLKSVMPGTR